MSESSGPSEDSGETRALMLVAQALQAATAESRSKYTVHNTILLWFMLASIICHLAQIVVMISCMPERIARELAITQSQHLTVNSNEDTRSRQVRDVLEGKFAKTRRTIE